MESISDKSIIKTKEAIFDKQISFYVIYYFIASALNATIKHAFPISERLHGIISILIGLSIVCFMLVPIKEVLRRSGRLFFEVIIIFTLVYISSTFFALSRGESLVFLLRNTAFLSFAWWIPIGVYSCSVNNKTILYNTCLKGSFVISILMVILWFSSHNLSNSSEYSMFMGFSLILPLLFHINEAFKSHRFIYILFSVFEVFMIVAFTNRGVILSLVVFILFKIILDNNSILGRAIGIVLVILGGVLLLSNYEQFTLFLLYKLNSWGIVSRTINMMLAGSITDTSGRSEIWQICYDMISEKPLLGWGLGGEYIEIAQRMGATPEEIGAGYSPHNGIIQNFVCFGVVGGLLASLIILIPLFSIHRIKNTFERYLVAIFTCAAIVPCLVSADGFFIKPEVAISLFIYYSRHT